MAQNYYDENDPDKKKMPSAGVMGGVGAVGVGLLKFGALKSLFSMGIYLLIEAQFLGWKVAIGVCLILFIRQMGQAFKAMEYGIPFAAPLFIPFFGVMSGFHSGLYAMLSGWQRAMISLAGPIAGGFASLAFLFGGILWNQNWLEASAALGFFINLYTLAPIGGLAGGKICAAIGRHVWILGLGFIVGLIYLINPYSLLSLALFSLPFLFLSGFGKIDMRVYDQMPGMERVIVAILFVSTALALYYGSSHTFAYLPHSNASQYNY